MAKALRCRYTACRKWFEPNKHRGEGTQFYCSRDCLKEAWKRRRRKPKRPTIVAPPGYTGRHVLSDAERMEARERYWLLGDTQRVIATDLHVSRTTISNTVRAGPPPHRSNGVYSAQPCDGCGKLFRTRDRTKTYCTPHCAMLKRNQKYRAKRRAAKVIVMDACLVCGATFPHQAMRRYCGERCFKDARNEVKKARRLSVRQARQQRRSADPAQDPGAVGAPGGLPGVQQPGRDGVAPGLRPDGDDGGGWHPLSVRGDLLRPLRRDPPVLAGGAGLR